MRAWLRFLWHATPARAQREGQRVSGQAPRQRRAPATPLLFFLPVNTHSQDPSSCPDRFATLSGLPDTLFPPPRVLPTRPKRAHATRARPCPGEPGRFRDQPLAAPSPNLVPAHICAPGLAILTCCPVREPGKPSALSQRSAQTQRTAEDRKRRELQGFLEAWYLLLSTRSH